MRSIAKYSDKEIQIKNEKAENKNIQKEERHKGRKKESSEGKTSRKVNNNEREK